MIVVGSTIPGKHARKKGQGFKCGKCEKIRNSAMCKQKLRKIRKLPPIGTNHICNVFQNLSFKSGRIVSNKTSNNLVVIFDVWFPQQWWVWKSWRNNLRGPMINVSNGDVLFSFLFQKNWMKTCCPECLQSSVDVKKPRKICSHKIRQWHSGSSRIPAPSRQWKIIRRIRCMAPPPIHDAVDLRAAGPPAGYLGPQDGAGGAWARLLYY